MQGSWSVVLIATLSLCLPASTAATVVGVGKIYSDFTFIMFMIFMSHEKHTSGVILLISLSVSIVQYTVYVYVEEDLGEGLKVLSTYLPESCEHKAQANDVIHYHYVGRLDNGTEFGKRFVLFGTCMYFHVRYTHVVMGIQMEDVS